MHMGDVWLRESGINKCWASLTYDCILKRFVSWSKDRHLVQGDVNTSPDVESVAGTAVKFCDDYTNSHILALTDEDGILYIFNTQLRGQRSLVAKWSVHKNAIFDLEWLPNLPRIVTASGHQVACLIDVQTQQTIDTFKGHVSSLKTIATRKTDPFVFATGGRDGCICVWDQRVARRSNSIPSSNEIKQAHASGSRQTRKSTSQSITGLSFQDETTLISCASNDSSIKVWDLRRSYVSLKGDPKSKHKFTYHGKSLKQVGYSGLTMDHTRSFIFANCIDDCIYQFSALNYQDEVLRSYSGHRNKTFFVKSAVSPDNKYILTGSSDNKARIYSTSGQRSYMLEGHSDEVTAVAWSRYETSKIATVSDDDTLRIWRIGEHYHDDIIEGTVKSLTTAHSDMTRIRSKQTPLKVYTTQLNTKLCNRGVRPWPILNGLNIQPKLSSPKKLLVSPRKTPTNNHSTTSLSRLASEGRPSAVANAKRKILDASPSSGFIPSSPSKRIRTEPPTSSCTQTSCSPQTRSTHVPGVNLSPIRINNSSKTIINITPSTSAKVSLADFSSPTANLPNSVLDPQTPKRQNKENSYQRQQQPDWLSQYSQERQQRIGSPSTLGGAGSATTPSRSAKKSAKSHAKTPTSSRTKPAPAHTLMNYFSPTTTAAAASTTNTSMRKGDNSDNT